MESKALKRALEQAVKETTYKLKGKSREDNLDKIFNIIILKCPDCNKTNVKNNGVFIECKDCGYSQMID
jgi:transcription elongation factor Elf1